MPAKDFADFFAAAAQVIPVLILAYVLETRGFLHENPQMSKYINLFLLFALVGEVFAMAGLALGSPAPEWPVPFVVLGFSGSLFLALRGLSPLMVPERAKNISPLNAESRITKFVLTKDLAGNYHFDLVATDTQAIATSEAYETKSSALARIELVKRNAANAEIDDQTAK